MNDWQLYQEKMNVFGKTNAAKKVNYKGIEYNSVTEMAEKLNISRVTANKWLKM